MYDTMPVTQPDNWIAPPFEARIMDGATAIAGNNASRVIIGRGATNSKVIWVAEGDEERMDIGRRKFFSEHSDLMQEADALLDGGPSEGCVYVELTTSGMSWGRGPTISDIHGSNMRTVDRVAWLLPDTDISAAWSKSETHMQAIGLMNAPQAPLSGPAPRTSAANRTSNALFQGEEPEATGGYWPSYLWTDGEVGEKVGTIKIPMGTGGLAYQEKGIAAAIYEYSKITTTPPKPKAATK